MGTILYLVGLVCAVLAVLDIFKKNISTVGKVIASVLVLLTSWVGPLVYYFYAKDHLEECSSRRFDGKWKRAGASHRPVSLGSATLLDFRERRCGAGREVVGRIVRVDQLAVGCDLAAYAPRDRREPRLVARERRRAGRRTLSVGRRLPCRSVPARGTDAKPVV